MLVAVTAGAWLQAAVPTWTLTSVQPMPNLEYSTVSPGLVVNSRVCVPCRPSPSAAMSPVGHSQVTGCMSPCSSAPMRLSVNLVLLPRLRTAGLDVEKALAGDRRCMLSRSHVSPMSGT